MKQIETADFLKQYDIPYLQELSTFGALNDSFLEHIVKHSEVFQLERGEILFTKDQMPDCFYTLVDGNICLYKGSRLHNVKLQTLQVGECVGFISMLCMHAIRGDVVAEEDAIVVKTCNAVFASLPEVDCEQFSIFLINLARNIGRAYIGDE